MGLYIKDSDVIVRVAQKVRFTDDPETEPNKMPTALLKRLISEAESHVEFDLSPRYASPFQTTDGAAFSTLPDRPTKDVLRTLCELQAVMRILETDFGSGGPIDSSKYSERLEKRYKKMLDDLLEVRKDSYNTFVKPPLPSLRLNYMNEEADTGFRGRVLTSGTTDEAGAYPAAQINSPGETYWNADLSEDWLE